MKSVSIIPNKDKMNIPIYHKESESKDHTQMLKDFCILIGLDYTNYRTVQECILSCGGVIITTKNSEYALTWLPEDLSNEQTEKLFDLEDFYKLFQDLEFFDFYANGLGKYSNEQNKGKEVLEEFYEALRSYQKEKGMHRNRVKEAS